MGADRAAHDRLSWCGPPACRATRPMALQKTYLHEHGTTLAGLMANHGVDPHDFLAEVHDVPLDALTPDPGLRAALERLPGRRLSSPTPTAPRRAGAGAAGAGRPVRRRLPHRAADLIAQARPRHLRADDRPATPSTRPPPPSSRTPSATWPAAALGMTTVLVGPARRRPRPPPSSHHRTDDARALPGRRPAQGDRLMTWIARDLKPSIEAAWEARDDISPSDPRARSREAVERGPRACWTPARLRVGRGGRRRLDHAPVAEEGGAAVLPPQPQHRMGAPARPGRPRAGPCWDKVPLKFAGWDDGRLRAPPASAPCPAPSCAQGAFIGQERGADALASSTSAPMSTRAPWSTPGPRSAPAPRSARTCTCPAASASAACWSRCRPTRPSSRTTASSAPAPRWPRA